jgi:DNA mismatch endonuclease, patch repair protein
MSRIRGKDTTPEKTVRSLLHRMGYRFRLHVRIPMGGRAKLPLRLEMAAQQRRPTGSQPSTLGGRAQAPQPSRPRFVRPDIVLVKQRVAIFVHGCFWHRHKDCKNCTTPTNRCECLRTATGKTQRKRRTRQTPSGG